MASATFAVMFLLLFLLFALTLTTCTGNPNRLERLKKEVVPGITERNLIELMGHADRITDFGAQYIFRYEEALVLLEFNYVVSVQWDPSQGPLTAMEAGFKEVQNAPLVRTTQPAYPDAEQRQERMVQLRYLIDSERALLRRFSKQSSFKQSASTLISNERADLAVIRIQRYERELANLR